METQKFTKLEIEKIGLFATPKTQEHIMSWIEQLPNSERVGAMTAFGMTWNYLADKINQNESIVILEKEK